MRVEDLEHCLNMGFTRCGTYIYQRTSRPSCCEVWQYRVNIDDFIYSDSHKKVIRKFHHFLNHDSIHGPPKQNLKVSENEDMKVEVSDNNAKQEQLKQITQDLSKVIETKYLSKESEDVSNKLKEILQK